MKSRMARVAWESHIQEWRKSGKSQSEYCRDHGISVWTFRGHLKKKVSKPVEQFAEIRMKPEIPAVIRIEVKGRYTIEVPIAADVITLERILRAIGATE